MEEINREIEAILRHAAAILSQARATLPQGKMMYRQALEIHKNLRDNPHRAKGCRKLPYRVYEKQIALIRDKLRETPINNEAARPKVMSVVEAMLRGEPRYLNRKDLGDPIYNEVIQAVAISREVKEIQRGKPSYLIRDDL